LAQLALLGVSGITPILLTRDAQACSPPLSGWYGSVATVGPREGITVAFICNMSCTALPEVTLTVRDADGEVAGALVQREFRTAAGWLVWKPAAPLAVGASYEVSFTSGLNAEARTTTYQVVDAQPGLAAASLPAFEAIGFVELVGGEACCEEGLADSCGGSPRCFPDRSNARTQVNVQVSWPGTEWNPTEVRLSGEFFTSGERRAVEPRVGAWLQGKLAPAGEGDEYCYEITAQNLLTEETRLFEGCIPAADVELPDAQARRNEANRSGAAGCLLPLAKYEATFCEVYSPQAMVQACDGNAPSVACQNAVTICAAPPATEETRADSSCAVAARSSSSWPWTLSALAAALVTFARRLRR
jgi:hypothetical protein